MKSIACIACLVVCALLALVFLLCLMLPAQYDVLGVSFILDTGGYVTFLGNDGSVAGFISPVVTLSLVVVSGLGFLILLPGLLKERRRAKWKRINAPRGFPAQRTDAPRGPSRNI